MQKAFAAVILAATFASAVYAQVPAKPAIAASPTIKVLTGLTVPEFEQEMQMMVQAVGANCGFCHVRNNFADDNHEKKVIARRMIEMTKLINSEFFPSYIPNDGESKLGRVTCMTCHQGEQKPKTN